MHENIKPFNARVEIRWSDLDPNFHVLHSRYYDFGAFCRMDFLVKHGFTPELMMEHHVGPILFREECIFKKELKFGDTIDINLLLSKNSTDNSRWSIQHEIRKNGNTLAAIINVDIAWMDTIKRKLTLPPPIMGEIIKHIPRTADFRLISK